MSQDDKPTMRVFDETTLPRVRAHYNDMHRGQTVGYVDAMTNRFQPGTSTNTTEMSIMEAVDNFQFEDASDPDFDANNLWHLYQTAEACRKEFPEQEWMALVGLLHDLGKSTLNRAGLPQWSIGGDIFPVGCAFQRDGIVFPEAFDENPDNADGRYNSPLGIYSAGCGFRALKMAYGHDQYMHDTLAAHKACTIPAEGMYIVRFHSFYPWHHDGAYAELADDLDKSMLPMLRRFQKCDLYSKADDLPDPAVLRPYYAELADKYCPGKLVWAV